MKCRRSIGGLSYRVVSSSGRVVVLCYDHWMTRQPLQAASNGRVCVEEGKPTVKRRQGLSLILQTDHRFLIPLAAFRGLLHSCRSGI